MNKVFLGGTVGDSKWRNELIGKLSIDSFNPVVDDWTPECMEIEEREKANADYRLYVITPETASTFSIAEIIDDSNKVPEKTIISLVRCYGGVTFSDRGFKHTQKVFDMAVDNGATQVDFDKLPEVLV